ARLKTYGAFFGDKNHKAFSRFCLCGHEKSGLSAFSHALRNIFKIYACDIKKYNPQNLILIY
ncbi:hypothetical protein ACPA2N_26860, partial [Ectopseudomonas hydrolytica]|uniref:hypothetical protein n=1 Tax=Ectopseudomonas hydrolytica TaxID=2493633 RepID=UPI003C2FE44E